MGSAGCRMVHDLLVSLPGFPGFPDRTDWGPETAVDVSTVGCFSEPLHVCSNVLCERRA